MQAPPISARQSGQTRIPPQQYGQAYHPRNNGSARNDRLAKALGWFSIGLGLAQILAPRTVSRAIGTTDHPGLMRAVGMREITAGVGILSQKKPTGWLWSRVAGDAMDLAMLGIAAAAPRNQRSRVALATAAVAGIAALDLLAGMKHSEADKFGQFRSEEGALFVEKSITVNRSAEECYRYWRDFNNFSRFMTHIESVQATSDKRSHWKAKAPMGGSVEWDAEVTVDQPNQLLAWHSVEGADVENAGTVRFEPATGGRGTVVRVEMQYSPPGGKVGAIAARLFGEDPSQQIDDDLRHFKQILETGVIPTNVGQSSGQRSAKARLLFRKGAPG